MENQQGQNLVLAPEAVLPLMSEPVPQEAQTSPAQEWIPLLEVPKRVGFGERRVSAAVAALGIKIEPRKRQSNKGKPFVNSVPLSTLPAISEYIKQEIERINAARREALNQNRTSGTFDASKNTAPFDAAPTASSATDANVAPATPISSTDSHIVHELRVEVAAKDALVAQLQSEITFLRSAFLKGQEMVATALSSRGPAIQ